MIKYLSALLVSTIVLADDPCSPRLVPMVTTRIPVFDSEGEPTETLQTISIAETDTRSLIVDYLTPQDTSVAGQFSMVGQIEAANLSSVARRIKYRQSIRIDEGMMPIFQEGSSLCWDPEKRTIIADYQMPVGPGENVTQEITWTVNLRLEGLLSDINGDGWVDAIDQGILLGDWGSSNPRSDLNFDGVVNGEDLGILFSQWSESSDDEES